MINEDELKQELMRHIDPHPFIVDSARFNDRDLWEIVKRIAAWADARARRECAEICKSKSLEYASEYDMEDINNRERDAWWLHERLCGATACEDAILATIKEPQE